MSAALSIEVERSASGLSCDPPGASIRLTESLTVEFRVRDLLEDEQTITSPSITVTEILTGTTVTFDTSPSVDDVEATVTQVVEGSKLAAGQSYLALLTFTTDDTWTVPLVLSVPQAVASTALATTDQLGTLLGSSVTLDTDRAQLLIDLATDLCQSVLAVLPPTARAVVLSVAARAYLNPTGIVAETVGPMSVQFGSTETGIYLTKGDVATLRRIAGVAGAFSVDTTPTDALEQFVDPLDRDIEGAETILLNEFTL